MFSLYKYASIFEAVHLKWMC